MTNNSRYRKVWGRENIWHFNREPLVAAFAGVAKVHEVVIDAVGGNVVGIRRALDSTQGGIAGMLDKGGTGDGGGGDGGGDGG
eukprot:CAMPEP_0115841794 /NCGR_PEP_ID=MMETSP0287-20121206/7470_1 /TAXON_ID=412157 /ORGANISM="Chrysochromulina rotalis, Strain UIO044" /LENGTH=82 /DNA_ID=CAMNT_0003295447 /DNA_START=255 /DNA_END=500 /DNA_ORIENTATION=-